MKKYIVLCAFCIALPSLASAQVMRSSPLEGRWVWDGQGNQESEYTEMVFVRDVMLLMHSQYSGTYFGGNFTYTSQNIRYSLAPISWRYQFSGNSLIITGDDGESITFVRREMAQSPIEGVWKKTDGDGYMIFTGDIIAFTYEAGYMGTRLEFGDKWFHLSYVEVSPRMEYTLNGRSLTIRMKSESSEEDIEFELVKVN